MPLIINKNKSLYTVKLGYIKLGFYEYMVYIEVLSRPERNPIDFNVKQAFREFLVSPALIRNYKAVISISFIWLQYLNQNCMKKLFRCLSSVCAARPYIW